MCHLPTSWLSAILFVLVYDSNMAIWVELSWTAFLALAGFPCMLPEPAGNSQEAQVGLTSCQLKHLGFPLCGLPCSCRLAQVFLVAVAGLRRPGHLPCE